jgi:hypothetical protein
MANHEFPMPANEIVGPGGAPECPLHMTWEYWARIGESVTRSQVRTFANVFVRLDVDRSWTALVSVSIYRDGHIAK